jgi:hypothetical protein
VLTRIAAPVDQKKERKKKKKKKKQRKLSPPNPCSLGRFSELFFNCLLY